MNVRNIDSAVLCAVQAPQVSSRPTPPDYHDSKQDIQRAQRQSGVNALQGVQPYGQGAIVALASVSYQNQSENSGFFNNRQRIKKGRTEKQKKKKK